MSDPSNDSASAGARVLIVDDDRAHAEALSDGLELDGYRCSITESGEAAVERMGEQTFEAILTDLVMHNVSGLQVLEEARTLQPEAAVLLVTGHASVETAVDAMRIGASDYIEKPVRLNELRTRLGRAIESRQLRRTNRELRAQLDERFGLEGLIGNSGPMRRVAQVVRQVGPTTATVLVLGESGTGKELVAQALHRSSPRAEKRFVAVNCAALAEGLIESELFGHVKGAFTGAIAPSEGRIVYADGGTLFLDEVGDMPLETQAKLLRVLESREVQPVGGNALRKVDIRLIAATNRDLEARVERNEFRQDLLYRLKVVTIDMPPLRERTGDVLLLIDHFLAEFAASHAREVRGISPEARTALVRYRWPGNVRELRNVMETMVLLAGSDVLDVADVPEEILAGAEAAAARGGGFELAGRSLAEVERALIEANLELVDGNRQKAATILGMSERTLYRKLKEYGL